MLQLVASRAEAARAQEELQRARNEVTVARNRLAFLTGLTNFQANLAPAPISTNISDLPADLEQRALAGRP
jgi:outer membrane protein TolC